jgi:hypothetical protein
MRHFQNGDSVANPDTVFISEDGRLKQADHISEIIKKNVAAIRRNANANCVISDQLIGDSSQVGIIVIDAVKEFLLGIHQDPVRQVCW